MKPLSQTRQAIVEGFMSEHDHQFVDDNIKWSDDELLEFANDLTQALKDYNEAVIRMVEGKEKDIKGLICPTRHDSHWSKDCEWKKYNQALNDIKKALNDTK